MHTIVHQKLYEFVVKSPFCKPDLWNGFPFLVSKNMYRSCENAGFMFRIEETIEIQLLH